MVSVLPAHDPDSVAERLARVYLVVGPLYRRVLRQVEHDLAPHGVSAGMRAVLDLLRRHGPLTVPQLGRLQSLSRQFVQRMVNDALDAGLVALAENPSHSRSRLVTLNPAGQEVIEGIVRREHEQLRRVGPLEPADVDICLAVLTRMLDSLDDIGVD